MSKFITMMTLFICYSLMAYSNYPNFHREELQSADTTAVSSKNRWFNKNNAYVHMRLITDSLAKEKIRYHNAELAIQKQGKMITDLNQDLKVKSEELSEVKNMNDKIQVFNLFIWEPLYNIVIACLFIVCLGIIIFLLYRSARFKREALRRIEQFNNLSEELKSLRSKSLEREARLGRELQTERNKLEDHLLKHGYSV